MSRTLSTAAKAALYASQMSALMPLFIRIDQPSLGSPLYFVDNTEALVYDGHTYLPYSFVFNPPDQTETGVSNATISIDGTTGEILQILQAFDTPATVTTVAGLLYPGLAPEPLVQWTFTLKDVTSDGFLVQGTLVYEERLDNDMGPLEMTAHTLPGIF